MPARSSATTRRRPQRPRSEHPEWHNFNITGGPYNGQPLEEQQEEQLPNHGAYYTNLSESPSPAIMENGWNDDLFPVDQTVDYYNKVRAAYPNQAMKLFYFDLGHNPRSATTVSTGDATKFQNAQNEWFKYYVKGEGPEPVGAHGSVTAITSFCPQTAGGSGHEYKARQLGEPRTGRNQPRAAPAEQTIQAPGTAPHDRVHVGNRLHNPGRGQQRLGRHLQTRPGSRGRLHGRRLLDRDRGILHSGDQRPGDRAPV